MRALRYKRIYDGLFAFNCAAAIACAVGSRYVPELVDPALVFTMSAVFFRIGTVKL